MMTLNTGQWRSSRSTVYGLAIEKLPVAGTLLCLPSQKITRGQPLLAAELEQL